MYEYKAKVVRQVDADTYWLDVNLGIDTHHMLTVRIVGINAPERSDPKHAASAKAAMDWLNANKDGKGYNLIRTFKDKREKYGRYLADFYGWGPDSSGLSAYLLREGLAKEYG